MEMDHKNLTEGVLRILLPLRWIWEDAEWLIEAIEKDLVQEDHMVELANLLIRATDMVDQDERIIAFSQASGLARQNRAEERAERSKEQTESEDNMRNFV